MRTAQKTSEVAGAVFGRDVIRLVRINGFYLEAVPEGFILMLNNRDVPGVVGAVGMLLGEAKINIAGLQLGRERIGGMALSLIHVDERIPRDVLDALAPAAEHRLGATCSSCERGSARRRAQIEVTACQRS